MENCVKMQVRTSAPVSNPKWNLVIRVKIPVNAEENESSEFLQEGYLIIFLTEI
jgi:hypothetical protein